MKNMKIKIVSAIVLIFTLGIGVSNWCFADNNHGDTGFYYRFSDYQPYSGWHTEKRDKLDYTSSYMSCHSASGREYFAWVSASNDKSEFITEVGSPEYRFYGGYTTYMINYVKERGYKYAAISARPKGTGSFTASGLWSPDSI